MSDKHEKCIYCGCTKDESGKWVSVLAIKDGHSDCTTKKTICASCSVEKFPQYYFNDARPGVWSRLKYQWLNMISSRGR